MSHVWSINKGRSPAKKKVKGFCVLEGGMKKGSKQAPYLTAQFRDAMRILLLSCDRGILFVTAQGGPSIGDCAACSQPRKLPSPSGAQL
jgi:hypothetical protein